MSSTANNTVIPAAYGDQVRDNLQAIYLGWWVRATGAVSQPVLNGAWAQVSMSVLDATYVSTVASSADPAVTISSGYLVVSKTGRWEISGGIVGGSVLVAALAVRATVGQAADASNSSAGGGTLTVATCEAISAPTYVSLWVYGNAATNLSATIAPYIDLTWLGDL